MPTTSETWDNNLDSGTQRTVVITVSIVAVVVVLVVTAILIVIFRDRIRGHYRRWRLNARHRQLRRTRTEDDNGDDRYRTGGGIAIHNNVALQLQLYAVHVNNANDDNDHVTLVFPGLLSAMSPPSPPTSSRRSRHHSPGRTLFRDDDGEDDEDAIMHFDAASDGGRSTERRDSSSDAVPRTMTLPGTAIAFGAGASTSFAHSTTTTIGAMHRSSSRVDSHARNPLASQTTSSRPQRSLAGRHLTDADADASRGDGAILGELIVPNIAFSLGYGIDDGDSIGASRSVFSESGRTGTSRHSRAPRPWWRGEADDEADRPGPRDAVQSSTGSSSSYGSGCDYQQREDAPCEAWKCSSLASSSHHSLGGRTSCSSTTSPDM